MIYNEVSAPRARYHKLLTPWLVALAILSSGIAMSYRFFTLIDSYSVNLLFFDQWDLYNSFILRENLWLLFSHQHGPPRMGIGMIITKIVAELTQWNSRADALTVGAIIIGAMLVAFYLKRRLFGKLTLGDAIIPLIFLTTVQYESLVITPMSSHGALPLLLVLLAAMAWWLRQTLARYTAIVVLNFLLIYTGFGLFMGLITPLLLALDVYQQARTGHNKAWLLPLVALALALASLYAFSIGYVFSSAVLCSEFQYQRPWEYLWFVSLMFSRFLGISYDLSALLASIFGCALFVLMVAVFVYHALILARSGLYASGISSTIAILIGYSLIFCANTAIGRICLGINSSQASRYMTLLIPAFFGLYLHLLTLHSTSLRSVTLVLCAVLLLLPMHASDMQVVQGFTVAKQHWKACYLKTEDIEKCGRVSGLLIYPAPSTLKERLAYLKQHHLNLFADK